LAAAQQAVLAFQQLPPSAPKTFIYTGNILNTITMAPLLSIGVGKAATAHIIQSAAAAYQDLGFRYVFLTDGEECGKLTGCRFIMPMRGKWREAHGSFYVQLAEGGEQRVWLQTFVKGVGYKKF
jgi:hypothetical protein